MQYHYNHLDIYAAWYFTPVSESEIKTNKMSCFQLITFGSHIWLETLWLSILFNYVRYWCSTNDPAKVVQHQNFDLKGLLLYPKLCNQVPSLSLSRWRTLTLFKIEQACIYLLRICTIQGWSWNVTTFPNFR